MKKNLLITLLTSLFFAACTNPSSKNLTQVSKIVLDLKGCTDSVAILEMFDFNEMGLIAQVDGKNGVFEIDASLSTEGAYLLRVGTIKIPFVYDGHDITFNGNCSDLNSIRVSGSPHTKCLLQFMDNVEKINKDIALQKEVYDSLIINNSEDTVTRLAKTVLDGKHQELNQVIKSYVDTVSHFQLALYALEYLNPVSELLFFEKFTNSISKRFPNNVTADSFKTLFVNNIEQIKKTEVKVGDIAPDFTLKDMNGKYVSLSNSRGKYVYLDFWASFCSPCRTESKNKNKIAKEFSNQNFDMISVSLDQNDTKWKNAIAKDSLNWIHLLEPNSWDSKLTEMYNLDKIPTNYLIDPSGKIIAKNLSMEELGEQLKDVFFIKLENAPEYSSSK